MIVKKIAPLFLISVLFFLNGFAQTEKGSRLIGGSGYFNVKDDFFFRLSPMYGQFIFDNFAVGAGATLDFVSGYERDDIGLALGPYLRYYIGNNASRLLFTGNLEYGSFSRRNQFDQYSEKAFSAGFGVGYVHFLTNQIGLEAILNYRNNWGSRFTYDELFINLGFQIHLARR